MKAFATAIRHGDLAALTAVLAQDVIFYSDGGGKVAAVQRPMHGAARVAQVILGFAKHYPPDKVEIVVTTLNGLPGFMVRDSTGTLLQTIALEPGSPGQIQAIYVQRNPDKLRHLTH